MILSDVKKIVIPEGEVTKITNSSGNTLWQGVGWHTIWSGSKTCSVNSNKSTISGSEDNFAQTKSGTGYKPKIRITFSYSRTNNSSPKFENAFIVNNKWKYSNESEQTSPITIEAVDNTTNSANLCTPACDQGSAYGYAGLRKRRDTENNRIIFDMYPKLSDNVTSYGGLFTITFTVTKIEQYY